MLALLLSGALSPHQLEASVGDPYRAVKLRRAHIAAALSPAMGGGRGGAPLAGVPHGAHDFDAAAFYKTVLGTNCESVIGFLPYPLGVVGPLPVDGEDFRVPFATTEGALVASTNRGASALRRAGGVATVVGADGMTRAPLVKMPSVAAAAALRAWVAAPENFARMRTVFDGTSRFGRLQALDVTLAGRNAYLRFKCSTGDAMGMNMITKGVNECLAELRCVQRLPPHTRTHTHTHSSQPAPRPPPLRSAVFPSMHVLALSGNMCTDKKPSAVNWLQGRGKSVAAEARLSGLVLRSVLKTSAEAMVELNVGKNLVGSAMAGSIGGFNAHASNIVTAVFLATGQDPAQNVESSNCITLFELDNSITDPADPTGKHGPGLHVSVSMPCVEVGTVGGGTGLPAQAACLDMLGLRGPHPTEPGANARKLARVVAAAVLAGELSLMAALTSNDLLNSHLRLNRKAAPPPVSMDTGAGGVDVAAAGGAGAGARRAHGAASGGAGSAGGGETVHPHPLHVVHSTEVLQNIQHHAFSAGAQQQHHHHPGRRFFETATARGAEQARAQQARALGFAPAKTLIAVPSGEQRDLFDEPRLAVP